MHFAVALLPEIPQPLVMHLLVLGGGDEARGGFRLVDRPIAVDLAPRGCFSGETAAASTRLGVIEATAVCG